MGPWRDCDSQKVRRERRVASKCLQPSDQGQQPAQSKNLILHLRIVFSSEPGSGGRGRHALPAVEQASKCHPMGSETELGVIRLPVAR